MRARERKGGFCLCLCRWCRWWSGRGAGRSLRVETGSLDVAARSISLTFGDCRKRNCTRGLVMADNVSVESKSEKGAVLAEAAAMRCDDDVRGRRERRASGAGIFL